MNDAILKVEDAHTYIGHHHILQGLSFEARADAVTVLIGRNGAGKSTTLRTIMGLLPAARGRVIFQSQEIQDKKPYEIDRLGLEFVPEDMGIFASLTVEENMRVAIMLNVLLMVIIGGMGTLYGGIVGASFLLITQTFLPDFQNLAQKLLPQATLLHNILERWLLLFGILFILVVIFFPKGVIGSVQDYLLQKKQIRQA